MEHPYDHGQFDFVTSRALRSMRRPLCLLWLIVTLLAGLACSLVGTTARSNANTTVMLIRLPTLTQTPLPTLTPTVLSIQPTETPVTSPPDNVSTLVPVLTNTVTSTIMLAIESIDSTPPAIATATNPIATPTNTIPASPVSVAVQIPTATVAASVTPEPTSTTVAVPSATPSPIVAPTQTPTATPTDMPTVTPTAMPTDTPTITPTATPRSISTTPGWSFSGVRMDRRDDNLLLYGNLTNHTGAPQQIEFISGVFYDDQGQVIAGEDRTIDYWPLLGAIPAEGYIPFEVLVDGIQTAASFGLSVQASSVGDAPHQNFEFSDVRQSTEDSTTCLTGTITNRGDGLEEYLVMAAILYDGQDQVINFGESDVIDDGEASAFEICIDPPNQGVARYELLAWGR